jgi:hypothetical protein
MLRGACETLVLGIAVLLSTSCSTPLSGFTCETSDDCRSEGDGICQPSKRCSVADGECTSGQRYGDLAGELSNQCVDEGTADAAPVIDAVGRIDANLDAADATKLDAADGSNGSDGGDGGDGGLVCPAPVGTTSCPSVECNGDSCCVFLTGQQDTNCTAICGLAFKTCKDAYESDVGGCAAGPKRPCSHNNVTLLCHCL